MIINHHFRVEIKAHNFNSSTVNKRFLPPVISISPVTFFISNRLRSDSDSDSDDSTWRGGSDSIGELNTCKKHKQNSSLKTYTYPSPSKAIPSLSSDTSDIKNINIVNANSNASDKIANKNSDTSDIIANKNRDTSNKIVKTKRSKTVRQAQTN